MKSEEIFKKDKLDLPEIINDDLTYYMQFGWKRLTNRVDKKKEGIKYSGNIYADTFQINDEK
tara:strand:- start:143 stop:328 length:186 start_codon:yes stop_codon:yes gene_type:complete